MVKCAYRHVAVDSNSPLAGIGPPDAPVSDAVDEHCSITSFHM